MMKIKNFVITHVFIFVWMIIIVRIFIYKIVSIFIYIITILNFKRFQFNVILQSVLINAFF
ncbi:hypothetical protein chmu60 [Choristoneura murinana nucleopolyhedrovirus]|uniref:Uncharacterized protein n=1 Tax=Choristoneura murinana nucleopolyhedrovirus TaxID=1987479 RepID=V9XPV0_9ABAC|nr:hypothetical protein chmu60 [Choristoneura murinana nucleopolyhedrovirus]AHD25547.1 hypothetical protein chmu60 [Choristoneura murinana nucleopolyhedrovirus]